MVMRLDGQVALVTGATSGIGAAVAATLVGAGATVMLSGRDAMRGQAVLDAIVRAGGKADFVAADLGDRDGCERIVAATVARFARLDVLVNNAGVVARKPVDTTTDDDWRRIMAVNVHAVFFTTRAALAVMKRQARGAVVNIASDASFVGTPNLAAYCASKGAVLQFTRAAALDHAADGIRVNAVCPTAVDTPMLDLEAADLGMDPAALRRLDAAAVPMGRIGRPQDVADAVLFLASDRAAFITGAALALDGGMTAA